MNERDFLERVKASVSLKDVLALLPTKRALFHPKVVIFLCENGGYSDYIRIISPVILNENLRETATVCLTSLVRYENGLYNISEKVLTYCDVTILVSRSKISEEALNNLTSLKRRNPKIRIVVDIDDDLFSITSSHPEYDLYLPVLGRLKKLLHISDLVTVSTAEVAHSLQRECIDTKCCVVPNYLDDRIWLTEEEGGLQMKRTVSAGVVKVLYFGTETHDGDLSILASVFPDVAARLRAEGKTLEFTVVGGTRLSLDFANVISVPSEKRNYPTFVSWIRSLGPFDFAVAPLDLSEKLNHAKSNLKYLEYSALGIPAVYTDIEAYAEDVQDSLNGFLVRGNNAEIWADKIMRLALDEEMRQMVGKAAFQDISQRYCLTDHFCEWCDVLEG